MGTTMLLLLMLLSHSLAQEEENTNTTTTTTTEFPGYESRCYCPGDPIFQERDSLTIKMVKLRHQTDYEGLNGTKDLNCTKFLLSELPESQVLKLCQFYFL